MIKKLLFILLFAFTISMGTAYAQDSIPGDVIEVVDTVILDEGVTEEPPVVEPPVVEPPAPAPVPLWLTILMTVIPLGMWLFSQYKMAAYEKMIEKISASGVIISERAEQIEQIGKHLVEITKDKKIDASEVKATVEMLQKFVQSFKKLPIQE